jgi:hypothetical protein
MHNISQKMVSLHSKLDSVNKLILEKNIYSRGQVKSNVNPLNMSIGT